MKRRIQAHPYHLVEPSPWPILISLAMLMLTGGSVLKFQGWDNKGIIMMIGITLVITTMTLWLRDIIREGTYEGDHTILVQKGLTIGFILFIVSEIFIFISVFWAYFHSSLVPGVEIGGIWPPKGIEGIDAYEIPILNTILLLTSGATVTWGHNALIKGKREEAIKGLISTIILAIIFTGLQGYEYWKAPFDFTSSVYGSTFYATTGLHGMHVIVGTIYLIVGVIRVIKYEMTKNHHVGLETAILYWHFVDIVWILLYIFIYVWGS